MLLENIEYMQSRTIILYYCIIYFIQKIDWIFYLVNMVPTKEGIKKTKYLGWHPRNYGQI
jgi:hypothetical protein